MVAFFSIILTIWVPMRIVKPFNSSHKAIVLTVLLAYIIGISVWHFTLIKRTGWPLVEDGSVDTWTYYEDTRVFTTYSPFSITKGDLVRAANKPAHLGYHYFLGTLTTLTYNPLYASRILKILFFFSGLTCLMRVWRTNFGDKLAVYGFVFLTVLFATPFYQIFRNYRDSIILALFMLSMAILDTVLRPIQHSIEPVNKSKTTFLWVSLLVVLWVLSCFRFYIAFVVLISVGIHFVIAGGLGAKKRMLLLTFATILSVFVLPKIIGATLSIMARAGSGRSIYGIYGMFRGVITPIPWQHFVPALIPAHCFYLLSLPYVFFAFFAHLKKNLTWHLFFVGAMIMVLGGLLKGSQERKRTAIVPVFVMWSLSNMAHKRGTHISQRVGNFEEQIYIDEPYGYDNSDIQIESDHDCYV